MKKLDKKMLFAAWACHNKNYFSYQTWHEPLKSIFKEFVTFDPQEYLYMHGRKAMNEKFLEVVREEKPDFIYLWLIYDEFDIETLKRVKEVSPKTRLVNFFGDDDVLFDNYSRYYALFIDYPLASHKMYFEKYKEEGIKNVFFSCGVNTRDLKPLDVGKEYDVTFIGTPMGDRAEFIKHLFEKGVKLRVYGAGWEKYPELKEIYGGKLPQSEMTKVINQSKINLSFTKNYAGKPGFKARVFEICACRAFVLSEYFEGYLEFLKDKKEINMFQTKEELLDKVKYFLKNEKEREAISDRAYNKVVEDYAQEKEFRKTFEKIVKINGKVPAKKLPRLDKEVVYISVRDLLRGKEEIKKMIENADYVAFEEDGTRISKYRDYFQVYSFEKTGKDISCCDYFVYSRWLGNYLSLYTYFAFKTLKKEDFFRLLRMSQLVVRKGYFLDNFEKFRYGKIYELMKENNTAFIAIPLVQVRGVNAIDFEEMKKVFLPEFEDDLRALRFHGKLWTSAYPYKLVLSSYLWNVALKPWVRKAMGKR